MGDEDDIFDYPTAWAIQKECGASLTHHPHCSSVPGWSPLSGPGLLCDCGALIDDAVRKYLEWDLWQEAVERQRQEKRTLLEVVSHWEEIAAQYRPAAQEAPSDE